MTTVKFVVTTPIRFEGVMRRPGQVVHLPADHPLVAGKKPAKKGRPGK